MLLCGLLTLLNGAGPARAGETGRTAATAPVDLGELSLAELLDVRIAKVYSASKHEQRVTQAPASVTIITADEIRKFGYRTLAGVMQGIRGVYVTDDRGYSYLGMRGFSPPGDYNSRTLLLVDGHKLNDDVYNSALIGTEGVIDIDLVERVEVIRGPSSSIYGASAFFGVINLITRQPADIGGLETSVDGGTFETLKTRLTYGRQMKNGLGVVLSGSFLTTHGQDRLYYPEFDTPENNDGVAEGADADRAQNWLARLSLGRLTFSSGYSRRDKHVPTAQYETVFNDSRHVASDATFFTDLKYEGEPAPGWQATARVYYDHYRYEGTYPYDYAAPGDPPAIALEFDDASAKSAGAEFQLTGKFLKQHTLILGAAYREAFHITQRNYTEDPRTYNLNTDQGEASGGIYAQGEFHLRPGLLLNAGLRYDRFSESGDTLNPRLGLIWQPSAAATVKLLYGTAYRAPNSYERDYYYADFAKAGGRLRPEKIRTLELVYEHYLGHGLLLSASGYEYGIDDLINQEIDPNDGLLVFANTDSITARGVEVELERRAEDGALFRASYAQQKAEQRRTGVAINNSPERMAKLNLLLPLFGRKVFAGAELQYLSGLETLAGNRTDGFMVANLTLLGRMLNESCELSATLSNVFNTNYAYPGSTATTQDVITQNGRTLRFKLTCRF